MNLLYIVFQIAFIILMLFVIRKVAERNKKLQEANKLSIQSGYYIVAIISVVFGLFMWWVVMQYIQNETAGYAISLIVVIGGILYGKKLYTRKIE